MAKIFVRTDKGDLIESITACAIHVNDPEARDYIHTLIDAAIFDACTHDHQDQTQGPITAKLNRVILSNKKGSI